MFCRTQSIPEVMYFGEEEFRFESELCFWSVCPGASVGSLALLDKWRGTMAGQTDPLSFAAACFGVFPPGPIA